MTSDGRAPFIDYVLYNITILRYRFLADYRVLLVKTVDRRQLYVSIETCKKYGKENPPTLVKSYLQTVSQPRDVRQRVAHDLRINDHSFAFFHFLELRFYDELWFSRISTQICYKNVCRPRRLTNINNDAATLDKQKSQFDICLFLFLFNRDLLNFENSLYEGIIN